MTNATVGTVSQTANGGIVQVTYKEGKSEFVALRQEMSRFWLMSWRIVHC